MEQQRKRNRCVSLQQEEEEEGQQEQKCTNKWQSNAVEHKKLLLPLKSKTQEDIHSSLGEFVVGSKHSSLQGSDSCTSGSVVHSGNEREQDFLLKELAKANHLSFTQTTGNDPSYNVHPYGSALSELAFLPTPQLAPSFHSSVPYDGDSSLLASLERPTFDGSTPTSSRSMFIPSTSIQSVALHNPYPSLRVRTPKEHRYYPHGGKRDHVVPTVIPRSAY